MLFNSIAFVVFFIVFFLFYWFFFGKNQKAQNLLVLAGSYFFYAWWDWRLLSLLIGSSLVNYLVGIYLPRSSSAQKKKALLWAGVLYGVATLSFFKYTNFFITSLIDAFAAFDIHLGIHTLNIILPLGISFYTFRTLSYILDVDKGKVKPTTDWVVFFSYVAFFPSLISGPIDRAKLLIPQLENKRTFDYNLAADGMRQILWGVFKKVAIADNCMESLNVIFENHQTLPASTLILGAFYFMIQMYADFSGYSDMAIGISKLLGFKITKNFNYPFFAQNIADYWKRWHISLTSWLTDYIFTPSSIRYRDWGNWGLIVSILITFLVSGLWHGADWTFVLWGFLHGCYYIPLILKGALNKKKKLTPGKFFPSFREFRNIAATFILVMFTNVIFRADSISQAFSYFRHIFSKSLISFPQEINAKILIPFFILFIVEWIQRDKEYGLQIADIKKPIMRYAIYTAVVGLIIMFGVLDQSGFIYFKF